MKTLVPCILAVVLFSVVSYAKIDSANLMCLVCRASIGELENSISQINPNRMVDVGNYRLDESGNIHQSKIPLAKSQVHLSELLDTLCKAMSDYVRVRYKATQKLAVMQMMVDGKMNSEFSKTDFVTDDDLNKSVEFYCDGLMGENEDYIVDLYSKFKGAGLPDGKTELCHNHLKLCQEWMLPNDEDRDWSHEKQREHAARHGADPFGWGGVPPAGGNPYEAADDDDIIDAGTLELKEEL